MDLKKKALEGLLANVNFSGLAAFAIDEILEESLQELVDSTENPFDNMLMEAVYGPLEGILKTKLEQYINRVTDGLNE